MSNEETRIQGPFPIIWEDDAEHPNQTPERRYDCNCYQGCLEVAATLNWETFSCNSPSGEPCCGTTDNKLIWKAHLALRDDSVAKKLCALPEIDCHETNEPKQSMLEAVALEPDYTYCERIRAVKK
jgi:hypothetical protein